MRPSRLQVQQGPRNGGLWVSGGVKGESDFASRFHIFDFPPKYGFLNAGAFFYCKNIKGYVLVQECFEHFMFHNMDVPAIAIEKTREFWTLQLNLYFLEVLNKEF